MKKLLLLIVLLLINQKIITLPLIIGNVTQNTILFDLELKNGHQRIFIKPQDKWTYSLNKENYFISISWKDYETDNMCKIDVRKQMPSMIRGGTVFIFNKGRFLYDDKTSNIKSGDAEIIK